MQIKRILYFTELLIDNKKTPLLSIGNKNNNNIKFTKMAINHLTPQELLVHQCFSPSPDITSCFFFFFLRGYIKDQVLFYN